MTKLTISLPEDLVEMIRTEAEVEGTTVSGFITKRLRGTNLLSEPTRRSLLLSERRAALAEYEAEHGKITEEEQERVRAWLRRGGVESPPSRSTPGH